MSNSVDCLGLLDLPIEVLELIVLQCDLKDFRSISLCCKFLREILCNEHIWNQKWDQLVKSSNLELHMPSRQYEHENFYHCSQRLLRVCYRSSMGVGSLPPEHDCDIAACSSKCNENEEKKFALDIGSKSTWVMTSGYFLERHPSVLVIPSSDTMTNEYGSYYTKSILRFPQRVNCLLCHQEIGDAIKKKNLMGPQLIKTEQLKLDFCSSLNLNFHEGASSSTYQQDIAEDIQTQPFTMKLPRSSNPLMQPKFKLWSEISFMLRDAKIDHEIFHPAQCFFGSEEFCYLEQYIFHIVHKLNMSEDIKKRNSSLIFCEPFNCTMALRQKLTEFFIEFLQAKRICFVNKSLATALLFGIGTCVVIDSGARNTVISVIIEGIVQSDRVKHCPVGGTDIAQYLADAIKLNGLKNDVYVPSLDSDRVKSRCYLTYNPSLEEKRGCSAKRKVFVRCTKEGPGPHLEEIRLGSELFLAPELMYTAMDLVNRLRIALHGLATDLVKEILSHVILTGSNTELKGFSTRLARDIQAAFPQHSHSIFLKSSSGSHSWDAVTGSMYVPIMYRDPEKLTESFWPPNKPTAGSILWISREEYILRGPSLFQE